MESETSSAYSITTNAGSSNGCVVTFDQRWGEAFSKQSEDLSKSVVEELRGSVPYIPHLNQYFGIYAMEESRFLGIYEHVKTPDLISAHIKEVKAQSSTTQPKPGEYSIENGIAVIELVGTMTKYGSSLSDLPYGTIGVRRAIRNAVDDSDVKGILLIIDSPGGSVAGTSDLAEDVALASKKKPVTAYIEDLGASAAYWVASQAETVVANPGALVGSIGTYMVVDDWSGFYQDKRIKTHVIKAGQYKGAGVRGSEITPEQIENFQQLVNDINELFISGVQSGRGIPEEKVRDLADGRVHEASKARKLGLIDKVQSKDVAVRQLMARCKDKRRGEGAEAEPISEESTMTQEVKTDSTAPKPASYDDIVLLCPGADEKFICAQFARKATEDQARSAWADEQNKRLAELAEKLKQAESKQDLPGAEPVADPKSKKPNYGGDVKLEWLAAIREKEAMGLSRFKAVRAVAKEQPELREALVEQANMGR